MTTYAPSERRQDWSNILTLASLTFIVSFISLLTLTWSVSTEWPALTGHPALWRDATVDLLIYQDVSTWVSYWQQLTQRQLHWHFVLHLLAPVSISLLLAYYTGRSQYVPGGRDDYRHISGSRLLLYRYALKHAKQQLSKERKDNPTRGLKLHPKLTITRKKESDNLFISGSQGSGKTVFLTPLIKQVIERGERCFIYDEKREFTALFHSDNSVLIAPWDTRSVAWDIQADASNATQAQLIAQKLIMDSDDPLWANGARMIFVGMVETLNHTQADWGWTELSDILTSDEAVLHKQLEQYYPRAARFIVEQSKTTQSFFAQLLGSLGWIFTLAEAWPKAYEGGFSMMCWVSNPDTDKPIIIVQADKRYADIGAPLCNALIALMTAHIIAQSNSSKRELWLFLDELGNLPKNGALQDWMSLGRSKGCRIVAGTQSISQLKEIYGEHGADTLLSMFKLFAAMSSGALGESATYAAKAFGERDVERHSNASFDDDKPSQQWQRETLPLVTSSDLVHLPPPTKHGVEGYLQLPGYKAVYLLRWPYPKLTTQADEHCPARWLTAAKGKTASDQPTTSRRDQLLKRRAQAC
jgi:type IV secretory pathway TraG/TraD family ATPase VirD4